MCTRYTHAAIACQEKNEKIFKKCDYFFINCFERMGRIFSHLRILTESVDLDEYNRDMKKGKGRCVRRRFCMQMYFS